MTMTVVEKRKTVRVTRYVQTTRATKDLREAALTLGAASVVLRARGQWLDERNEPVDLERVYAPLRDVKSVWVDASVGGQWRKIRPNADPTLKDGSVPQIEIEITFQAP